MSALPSVDPNEFRAGVRDAFASLFRAEHDRLFALAYRMTSSVADAEDVVQEAFVATLRHHAQFQGDALPSTWLYRVTINAALMRLRSRRRKAASSLDALTPEAAEAQLQHALAALTGHSDDNHAERAEMRAAVDAALEALKPVDQRIVRMRLCEGMTTEEVSEATGLSASAVKTRLFRARALLKSILQCDERVAA